MGDWWIGCETWRPPFDRVAWPAEPRHRRLLAPGPSRVERDEREGVVAGNLVLARSNRTTSRLVFLDDGTRPRLDGVPALPVADELVDHLEEISRRPAPGR